MCYTLQAMGKGKESLILSAYRQDLFNIPMLFLMNCCAGLYGVIWTQFIADALTVVVSFIIYRYVFKQLSRTQKQTS